MWFTVDAKLGLVPTFRNSFGALQRRAPQRAHAVEGLRPDERKGDLWLSREVARQTYCNVVGQAHPPASPRWEAAF